MGIHYVIHDLYPALKSDHLRRKRFNWDQHLQVNNNRVWLPEFHCRKKLSVNFTKQANKHSSYHMFKILSLRESVYKTAFSHVCKRTYLKNYYPGIDNVVEVDGTFVGVTTPCVATGVILVPVDAQTHGITRTTTVCHGLRTQAQGLSVERIFPVQAACAASFSPCRHIRTWHDTVIRRQRANEGSFIILLWLVVRRWQGHTWRAGVMMG